MSKANKAFFLDLEEELRLCTSRAKIPILRKVRGRHPHLTDRLEKFIDVYLLTGCSSSEAKKGILSGEYNKLKTRWLQIIHRDASCKGCGNHIHHTSLFKTSHVKFCSAKCSNSHPDTKDAKAKTNLRNLGTEHNWSRGPGRNNRDKTMVRKYGSTIPCQNAQLKKKQEQTCIERYGVANAFQNLDVQRKAHRTCLEKLGVKTPLESPAIHQKSVATWEKKYGTDNPFKAREVKLKIKKALLRKYGVDNPTKNPVILRKALATSVKKHSVVIEGIEHLVQGTFELRLVMRLAERFGSDQVVSQFSEQFPTKKAERECGYLPDFFVKSANRFVECKSDWTLLKGHKGNQLKRNREKARRNPRLIWVVGIGKIWITLPPGWCNLTLNSLRRILYQSPKAVW